MGASSRPVESSTEHPASPAPTARRSVSATSAGSSPKAFSRSAETGRSVASTIEAAWPTASSRVTDPSSRPRVAAWPLLVVASAWNPSEASSLAEPWSHALGISSGRSPWCRARNLVAFSAWSVIRVRSPRRHSDRYEFASAGAERRARGDAPAVEEVAGALGGDGGRGDQPDQRVGTLGGAAREGPDEAHRGLHQRPVVAVEAAGDHARMETVGGHPGSACASRQLDGEQDVGELGLAVAAEATATVGALGVEVVERDPRWLVGVRRGGDHPRRGAMPQPFEQQRGQQERGEVVDCPGQLDAVLGDLARAVDGAGVVDQDVQPRVAVEDLAGQAAHRRLRGEVGHQHVDATAAGRLDPRHRPAGLGVVTGDDRQLGAACRQRLRAGQPDAVGRTGEQDLLAGRAPLRHDRRSSVRIRRPPTRRGYHTVPASAQEAAVTTYLPAPGRYDAMQYRRAGRSGLQLPAMSLGLWQNFGGDRPMETQRAIIRRAFDLGITHFDLANNYGPPYGSAEENFGRILAADLRGHRDELIISTKAGYDMWPGPYGDWGSRKYLHASLDQSLRRMGLDYVDIFYSHRVDPQTPLEETMGALDAAVREGKALYVGVSSYSARHTAEAAAILRRLGTPLLIHQPSYSILNRWIEGGLLQVLGEEGIGCIVFSPLAQGLLTDRYLGGIPEGSRASRPGSMSADMLSEENLAKVRALHQVAAGRGQSLAQLALSWTLRDPRVTSTLIGASSVAQLDSNVAALDRLLFDDDELAAIDRHATEGNVNLWASSSHA